MAESDGFFLLIAGTVVGVVLFISGFKSFKLKQLIENIPTSKARSVAMGLAEVYGRVVAPKNKILVAPLSAKKCVYYNAVVQELRRSRRSSHWVTVLRRSEGIHFYLKDATGQVLVDPKNAQLDTKLSFDMRNSWGKTAPSNIIKFLEANGRSNKSLFGFKKTMRYREYIVKPQDSLYIMGYAGNNPFVKAGTAVKGEQNVMFQKQGKSPYYISDKSEKQLLGSLTWKVRLGLFGGPALTVACLAGIFIYLGVF